MVFDTHINTTVPEGLIEKVFAEENIAANLISSFEQKEEFEELVRLEMARNDDLECFLAVNLAGPIKKFQRWSSLFPSIKPFYAVKCNPNPAIIRALSLLPGCGFDCASQGEMEQVLKTGIKSNRIIFAHPCKSIKGLQYAFKAKVYTMTFDSEEELDKINDMIDKSEDVDSNALRNKVQLVLRLRVPDSHSDLPLGEKFGANIELCPDLIQKTKDLGLNLVGVSFHCGSGCFDALAYVNALQMAKEVFQMAAASQITLKVLDIGGGFPGIDGSEDTEEQQFSTEDIANVVNPFIQEHFPAEMNVEVIAEPGRYFVQACQRFVAEIYAKRWVPSVPKQSISEGKKAVYFISEGVYGCFKDVLLCEETFTPIPLKRDSNDVLNDQVCFESSINGPSGNSKDCIVNTITLPELEEGDLVYFDRFGAYTVSVASYEWSEAIKTPILYLCEERFLQNKVP